MNTLLIAKFTLHEAVSRRLILAGLLISLLYLGLFALGFNFAQAKLLEQASNPSQRLVIGSLVAGLVVLGIYVVYFMGAFLSLFLSVAGISAEIDSGTLHAILARPLHRAEFVLGRWLAYAALVSGYLVLMMGGVLAASHFIAGYDVPRPLLALGLMLLGNMVLVTLSLFGSAIFPTLANGIVIFTLLGLSWLGGMIEWVGLAIANQQMVNLATVVSLLMPSDALWRAASYHLQAPILLTASAGVASRALPFLSSDPPAPALIWWSVGYLVVFLFGTTLIFRTRDL